MKRPFHIAGLVWLGAAFLAAITGFSILPVVLAAAGLLALLILRRKKETALIAVLFAFCAASAVTGIFYECKIAPTEPYIGSVQKVSGAVMDVVSYPNYTTLTVRTSNENPKGLRNIQISVGIPGTLDAAVGDVINCTVSLSLPPERKTALYAQNILLQGSPVGEVAVQKQAARGFFSTLAHYRNSIYSNITGQLTGDEGVILAGMLLGKTEQIPADVRSDYARTGISHLLSVSGLHLSILVGIFEAILASMYLSRRQRSILLMAFVVIFMGLAGFAYSIVRSGVMLLIYLSAGLFGRDSDSLNSLGFAVILILLWNPYAAFSLSLQLSYLATMGIAAFAAPLADAAAKWWGREQTNFALSRVSRWRSVLISAFAATVSANLLTLPIVCYTFGQVPLVSPIVNLLIMPLSPVALAAALLMGLTGFFPFLSFATRFLGLAGGLAIKAINSLASWWSALPFAAVPVRSDAVVLWLLAAVVLGVLFYTMRTPRAIRRYAACLMGLVLLASSFTQAAAQGDLLQIAVAQNGDTVALIHGEQSVIIGSPASMRDARELCALLKSSGVTRVDLLIADKDDVLYSQQVELLARTFPVETAFGLDKTPGFTAQAFGCVTLSAQGSGSKAVAIRIGSLQLQKRFDMQPAQAHVLINDRNDLITAPGIQIRQNDRYFRSTVLYLQAPESNKQEVAPI